jgi:hypothetical protein
VSLVLCDGRITATVEEHIVQWNLVVLKILSWRREEEKKLKERNLRRRRRNSHCASASARSAGETRPKTGHVTSVPASAVTSPPSKPPNALIWVYKRNRIFDENP